MKEFAKNFYNSPGWKHTRAAFFKSKGGICERCYRQGLITPGEIVHHKIELTPANINDPEITLNWDNLELLCRNCHGEAHDGQRKRQALERKYLGKRIKRKRKRRYIVDKRGKVTAL